MGEMGEHGEPKTMGLGMDELSGLLQQRASQIAELQAAIQQQQ